MMTMPVFVLVVKGLTSSFSEDVWVHFKDVLLLDLFFNTLWPLLGVGILSLILGSTCAFLTVFCQYPGKNIFKWLFILPLAFPLYVSSFVYVGLLEYSGPFLSYLRDTGGFYLGNYFKIKSLPGVCIIFSLFLYPYVYLIMRNAFLSIEKKVILQARSLGMSPQRTFFKLILPICRPWMLGSTLLVMMETLSDFGGFSAFNYETLTTAIYTAWFGLFSITTASKLAVILILIAFLLIIYEQKTKSKAYYGNKEEVIPFSYPLSFWGKYFGLVFSLILFGLSFIVPLSQLVIWSVGKWNISNYEFLFSHSIIFALGGAIFTVALGGFWAFLKRLGKFKHLINISILGYALPSTLIALSAFICFKFLGIYLSWGGILILFFAYAIRFLIVGYRPVDNAYHRINPHLDLAAQSLGQNRWTIFKRIHFPLINKNIATAFLLILMELLKEMPITLLIRPFNWDTLAVKIFEFTSEGEWEKASIPAILLVLLGMITVFIINKREKNETYIGT